METKKFTVVDSRTGLIKTFDSVATTLGELKGELRAMGILVDGMSIQEGLTQTTLETDNSVLPHDVPFRGTTTNNLVFRITQSEKRIKSGVDRKEIYKLIKKTEGLAEVIKNTFGRNFTQVPTEDLKKMVCNCKKEESTSKAITAIDVAKVVQALIEVLYNNGILESEDIDDIAKASGQTFTIHNEESNDSIYSNEELADMFKDM